MIKKENILRFVSNLRQHYSNTNYVRNATHHFFMVLPFWFAGLITAVFATLYARFFHFFESKAILLFSNFELWSLLIVPLLFMLSWFFVDCFAPYSNGSGIPQLMAAAEISQHDSKNIFIRKLLGLRIIIVKVISSLLAVLGGGAIGREGPTLQIAGSVFHITEKLFKGKLQTENLHIMVLAGGAAGLASAFNTPLGGIVYVVEELSRSHLSVFRTGVLHSVIVAGLIAQLIMGPYLYFGYPQVFFHFSQIAMLIFVAVTAGISTTVFAKSLKQIVICRALIDTRLKKAVVALLCGLIFAGFALFASKTIIGSGKELINELLFDNKVAGLSDCFSRLFGPVITYAIGGAGGIFAPTLSLGGAAASYFGSLIGSTLGPVGVLAGMTAALSALTQSPFTSFVLILEMTDRHAAIFPLMIAALLGHAVSKLFSRQSFYEFVCQRILSQRHS